MLIKKLTVPVTPMTLVKFNFKFANPSKSYEIHKTRTRRFAFTRTPVKCCYWKHESNNRNNNYSGLRNVLFKATSKYKLTI
jgi:hypothetical protein